METGMGVSHAMIMARVNELQRQFEEVCNDSKNASKEEALRAFNKAKCISLEICVFGEFLAGEGLEEKLQDSISSQKFISAEAYKRVINWLAENGK
jgi:hypothetical protein